MATLLRSSKYIRCLNIFARRIVVANDNSTFVKKSPELQAQCANSYLAKSYATAAAIQENRLDFDKLFARLDENVQRFGRVFKPEVDEVLSKVRDTGSITSLDALLLIRCCGDLLVDTVTKDRNILVEEIWSTIETLKTPIDVSHFNALLRVYLENDYQFSPIKFLTAMRDKGVEPNRITYQRLILHYCKRGDIEGATKILEFMREKGLPLNEGVFSALITGHSEANDMDSAKNILNVMRDAKIGPGSSTYTALLAAYAKRGDMASIKQLLNEIHTENVYLQDNDYFEVITALAANDHTDKVHEILTILPKGPNYNLNASHAILKILDVGNVDVALMILPTMKSPSRVISETSDFEKGIFLIRKLVNAKYPVKKIIETCQRMQEKGENIRAFVTATERSLINADFERSIPLLEAWSNNGGEIREHYFWPLLVSHGKASNYNGILDVIKLMHTKFGILPTFETIKDFVLPYTVGKWDDVTSSLRDLQISHDTIVTAIANRMLTDLKTRKTVRFMISYPARHELEHFYRPLANAVVLNNDSRSYAVILRLLCESSTVDPVKIVDNAMRTLLSYLPDNQYEILDMVLEYLLKTGLTISPEVGREIREILGDHMSSLTEERIEKLTSGTLQPMSLSEICDSMIPVDDSNFDGLQRNSLLSSRAEFGVKRRELDAALRKNDAETIQKITEELESAEFKFSPAACAQIIEVFCTAKNLEMAEKWVKKCRSEFPNATFDLQKSTLYAALLVKNGRFDDAIKFILEAPRFKNPENNTPPINVLVKGLLDVVSETGNVEKTTEIFDALLKSRYMAVDNYMLGSLVKVHLVRNDLASALDAFENACKIHRCTPMKNELSKKLIDAEDANALQRLTDLSTQIHGESNSLIDLVLSFIECGRLRQARKILETPGLRLRGRKLKRASERYVDEGANDYLEQFIDITKGLLVIDRQELYESIMHAYYKKNNWQRALTLWTAIQEEDIQPSNSFLRTLADLLRRNNQPVPFAYNNYDTTDAESESDALNNRSIHEFYQAIDAIDVQKAEQILRDLPSDHKEFTTAASALISTLVNQCNDLDGGCRIAEELIWKNEKYPRAHALKLLWNTMIEMRQFEKLKKHGHILTPAIKKQLRFNKYLLRAELIEVGLKQFLHDFTAKITDSATHNFNVVKNGLHFSSLVTEFIKDPSDVENFHSVAEKLAEQEIYSPINIVWCYYFVTNKPEADAVWSKYFSNSDRIMFKYIFENCRKNNDIEMAERLYQKLGTNQGLSDSARTLAMSSLIELYNKNGRVEDALKVVEGVSPSVINLWNNLYPVAVKNFQESLKASGKSLPSGINVRGNQANNNVNIVE